MPDEVGVLAPNGEAVDAEALGSIMPDEGSFSLEGATGGIEASVMVDGETAGVSLVLLLVLASAFDDEKMLEGGRPLVPGRLDGGFVPSGPAAPRKLNSPG